MTSLGLGLGLGLQRGKAAATFELPLTLTTVAGLEAPLEIGLTPFSLVESGGVVSSSQDVSGNGRHHTATACTLYTAGPVPGIELNGTTSRLDWSGSGFLDTPCTIFLLHQVIAYPSAGAYSGIFEMSDTSGSDRSHWLYAYGSSDTIGARTGDSVGGMSYTNLTGATDIRVTRLDVTGLARALRKNGRAKVSNAITRTPRSVTRTRIGQRVAGDVSNHRGVLFALAVYSGELDEASVALVEAGLRLWGGEIAGPFAYEDIPTGTPSGDPELLMPATMTVYGGVPLRVDHYGVRNRTRRTSISVTSPDSFDVDNGTPGHTMISTLGGCTINVTEGAFTTSTIVTSYDELQLGQPKKYVLAFGNSQVHRMQHALFEMIYSLLGSSRIQFVGTVSPDSVDYLNGKAEGRDSWVLSETARALGAKGCFDGVTGDDGPSPFYSGGVLDIASYAPGLAHAPTHVLTSCFQNAPYLSVAGDAELATVLAAEKAAAVNIYTAMNAQWPNIPIGITDEWTLHADPSLWGGQAGRDAIHHRMHEAAKAVHALVTQCQGLGLNVELIPTHAHVGPGAGPLDPWDDSIHLSPYGHQQLLPTVLGWLFAH